MANQIDILIDNLKETFKAIEKFLLLGFTASLVLIALALTDRKLLGTQELMIANVNAPAVLVAIVAFGTYFAAGTFAALHFITRRRIVKKLLEHDPQVLEALLTYPSIVSRIGTLQVLALLGVGGTGMVALLLFTVPMLGLGKLLVFVVIGAPYIVLVGLAFQTAVQERITSLRNK